MRLQNGDTQEAVVREAVTRELSRLPDVVAAAVREALEGYNLTPKVEVYASGQVKIHGLLDGSEAAQFEYGTLQIVHFAL